MLDIELTSLLSFYVLILSLSSMANMTHTCNVKVILLMMSHPVLPVCLVCLPAYLVLILLSHLSCSVVPDNCAIDVHTSCAD